MQARHGVQYAYCKLLQACADSHPCYRVPTQHGADLANCPCKSTLGDCIVAHRALYHLQVQLPATIQQCSNNALLQRIQTACCRQRKRANSCPHSDQTHVLWCQHSRRSCQPVYSSRQRMDVSARASGIVRFVDNNFLPLGLAAALLGGLAFPQAAVALGNADISRIATTIIFVLSGALRCPFLTALGEPFPRVAPQYCTL